MSSPDQRPAARRWLPWLAAVWVPALLLIGAIVPAARFTGHPVSLFTRDVFSIAGIPVYAALLSNVGVFLWCAAAALCLFTAVAVAAGRGPRLYYAGFGVLSLMFLGDDFFMLHEWIVPNFLGLPESSAPVVYATLLGALVLAARREVLAREPGLLGCAVAMFGASVAMDLVEEIPAPAWHYLTEEGFKFLGIVAWCTYFVRACARERRPA